MKCTRSVVNLVLILAAAASAVWPAAALHADTHTVTSTGASGPGTLAGEVAAAESGDQIDFNLSLPATIDTSGTVEIGAGRSLTITGPGATALTVHGDGTSPVFSVTAGSTLSISGLTITNGTQGILNNGGTLAVDGCVVTANLGEGIMNGLMSFVLPDGQEVCIYSQATAAVSNSTISQNEGTGITNAISVFTVSGSTINGNAASGSGGGILTYGGSACADSAPVSLSTSATVTNTVIENNTAASHGAGIAVESGSALSLSGTTLRHNVMEVGGPHYGGGLYCAGTCTISGSSFVANEAHSITGEGGGLYLASGSATIGNTTFSGNSTAGATDNRGGAIRTAGGTTLTLANCTISGNAATEGGGLEIGGSATLKNSIVANNTGGNCASTGGTLTDGGHNLQNADDSCGFGSFRAVLLGSLTGSPPFLPPLAKSPAIDAGEDAVCAAAPVDGVSQNGPKRPQAGHCDIGAAELAYSEFRSAAAMDGWILETAETSGHGGTTNATSSELRLGDDAKDRQYRALLSFDTRALTATARFVQGALSLRRLGVVGANPLKTHGSLVVDVRRPFFGGGAALAFSDFEAPAGMSNAAVIQVAPVGGRQIAPLRSTALGQINRSGTTQFRLRFAKDDNDDRAADYLRLSSGNAPAVAARPLLGLYWYEP